MTKENKILVLCPSRGRPKLCKLMVDSFLENSHSSTIKLLLDMDDKCLEEYRDIIKGVSYTIGFRKPTTELINDHWQFSSECFNYFSVTNDDFIYHTKDWDKHLINSLIPNHGIGIAYGNDLLQKENMPTTSVISREIVEALGWLQMPRLTHLFGDNVWYVLGKSARCLHYNKDVIIEHKHVFANKALKDETFEHTNSRKMYEVDQRAFIDWLQFDQKNDTEKILQVLQRNVVNA